MQKESEISHLKAELMKSQNKEIEWQAKFKAKDLDIEVEKKNFFDAQKEFIRKDQ